MDKMTNQQIHFSNNSIDITIERNCYYIFYVNYNIITGLVSLLMFWIKNLLIKKHSFFFLPYFCSSFIYGFLPSFNFFSFYIKPIQTQTSSENMYICEYIIYRNYMPKKIYN